MLIPKINQRFRVDSSTEVKTCYGYFLIGESYTKNNQDECKISKDYEEARNSIVHLIITTPYVGGVVEVTRIIELL